MEKKAKPLSHDEIWDDSALVDSWNEALEEYKKYHSIHAKGGKLKDLKQAGLNTSDAERNSQADDTGDGPEGIEADELSTTAGGVELDEQAHKSGNMGAPLTNEAQAVPAMPAMPPQLVMGSVRDESLKRLLMSWYYAGYYTGLYEGQQQAKQEAPQKGS